MYYSMTFDETQANSGSSHSKPDCECKSATSDLDDPAAITSTTELYFDGQDHKSYATATVEAMPFGDAPRTYMLWMRPDAGANGVPFSLGVWNGQPGSYFDRRAHPVNTAHPDHQTKTTH